MNKEKRGTMASAVASATAVAGDSLYTVRFALCRQIPLCLLNHLLLPRCLAPVFREEVLGNRVPEFTRFVAVLFGQGPDVFGDEGELVQVEQDFPFLRRSSASARDSYR